MKENPKISVIVPMYKVEKFIPRCMESIKNQTFKDFEVLMIDDGSPDKSAELAEKFAKEDERFILFHKTNGGLSDARNYGLERAKGKYVVFIDSDDCVHKDYLRVLYDECENNGADISYCNFYHSFFMSKLILPSFSHIRTGVFEKEKALNMLIGDRYLHSFAWNKMYKKSLFADNHITYPKIYFEDVATSARVFLHANRVAVTKKSLYYYEKRGGSIMATMDMRKVNHLMLSILFIKNYVCYKNYYEICRHSIDRISKKMYMINWYSITAEHVKAWNFKGMKENFGINRKLYEYLISPDYTPTKNDPVLPVELKQPHNNS